MYKTMLDRVDAGIILLNETMHIELWNGWLESYAGMTAESVLGKPVSEVIPVLQQPYYRQILENALKAGQPMFCSGAFHPVFVMPRETHRRELVKQNLQIEPFIQNGQPYLMLQILDITNQYRRVQLLNEKVVSERAAVKALQASEERSMQLAREASEANEAKSRFLAHMSHELRTPLNGVIGYSQLLANSQLNHQQRQYVTHVKQSAEILLEMVNDVLDISKIEAGKMELHPVATDLEELCQQAVGMLTYQAQEKKLSLKLSMPGDFPRHVLVDPLRLKQILVNLLSNAVKFTPAGEVELKVFYDFQVRGKCRFTFLVRDTGIGIDLKQQHRIFEAFSQADGSITRQYGGTGLGLSISSHLAELMGSRLDFTSDPRRGSTFFFVLELPRSEALGNPQKGELKEDTPVADEIKAGNEHDTSETTVIFSDAKEPAAEEYRDGATERQWTGDGQRPVVLVVDDMSLNRELLVALVTQLLPQASLMEAANGKEALEAMKTHTVDIVFMDIQMPVMDGLTATREYRQYEQRSGATSRLPVIGLSAGAMPEEIAAAHEAGMDDYLMKPVFQEALRQVLEKSPAIETKTAPVDG